MAIRGLLNGGEAFIKYNLERQAHAHPLRKTHYGMVNRCHNPKTHNYPKYGGNGIRVTPEWLDVIPFMFAIDALLGPRPEGHTLDRINPHGDYVEWNVRWADEKTQKANSKKKVADYYSQCGKH